MTGDARNGTRPVEEVGTLIDELLAEQRRLTAVEKFSRAHDRHDAPLLEPHYRDLIPLTAPRPGEQYAFEVNLDQCSGCKACVTACHSLNGLDEGESWREVGFLVGEAIVPLELARAGEKGGRGERENSTPAPRLPFSPALGNKVIPLQQTVTTACHHCVEPACLLGCPVLAYDKDPVTGIVRHLDDQCIGCSYCILMCPYDVPKYSAKRGIVRKCDMCHGRLAEGEAPACVQACPNEAIRITFVKPAAVAIEFRTPSVRPVAGSKLPVAGLDHNATATGHRPPATGNAWLPDAPAPHYTLPTTRYVSARPNATLRAADHCEPKPQPAHWPLVFMLVLTQAGIGGFFGAVLVGLASSLSAGLPVPGPFTGWKPVATGQMAVPLLAAVSFGLLAAGLAASVLHLGQPKKAWRVWLGWRTSWLSREAIALNAFAAVATGALALLWAGKVPPTSRLPAGLVTLLQKAGETPALLWSAPVLALGLFALFAQAMVYADTHRKFWRLRSTAPRFLGTALVLGAALALRFAPSPPLALGLLFVSLLKLASELAVLKHGDSDADHWTQLRRTAALQRGGLRPVLGTRLLLGFFGGVLLPFAVAVGARAPVWAGAVFALCLLGELAERYLFFTSVSPDKMPGRP